MGIIHRDLKPENVLLDARSGNVRITDFNAALFVQNGGQPLADGDVFTQEKVGSEPYLAWETARRQWYGKMVDWWALGCVTFDLLTNTVSVVHISGLGTGWDGVRSAYLGWPLTLRSRPTERFGGCFFHFAVCGLLDVWSHDGVLTGTTAGLSGSVRRSTVQVLFKNHGARKMYVDWDRSVEGMSYLQSVGDLTDEEESVISGVRLFFFPPLCPPLDRKSVV